MKCGECKRFSPLEHGHECDVTGVHVAAWHPACELMELRSELARLRRIEAAARAYDEQEGHTDGRICNILCGLGPDGKAVE